MLSEWRILSISAENSCSLDGKVKDARVGGTKENEVLAWGPWSTPGLLSLSQGHWKECYSFKIYSLASSKKRLGTGYIRKNSCKLTFLKMKWNRAPLKKVGSRDVLKTCFGALQHSPSEFGLCFWKNKKRESGEAGKRKFQFHLQISFLPPAHLVSIDHGMLE